MADKDDVDGVMGVERCCAQPWFKDGTWRESEAGIRVVCRGPELPSYGDGARWF